jgi:uncharacterized surface protein with fasciclin (FAS1) repeats
MTLRRALISAVLVVAGAFDVGAAQAQEKNCWDVLAGIPSVARFTQAMRRTGQNRLLQANYPITVMAPNDEAVAKVPSHLLTDVFGSQPTETVDPYKAPAVVGAHLMQGRYTTADVRGQNAVSVVTYDGNVMSFVRGEGGRFMVTPEGSRRSVEASVVQADIPCSNGVIHVVDAVLVR